MKTKLLLLIIAFTMAIGNAEARKVVKVKAANYDISDNLDLEAVASLFGDADNLKEFERRLNDPKLRISNLDLNEDGYVDYLRVIEFSENGNFLIAIQAVLGDDLFQDVATIDVNRFENDRYSVILVGNDYLFGSNYIIEPIYVHRPTIFGFFFSPYYKPWHSPYHWGYYPKYYTYYRPYPVYRYQKHIHIHVNSHHHFRYHDSYDRHGHNFHNEYSRNDYGKRRPDYTFDKRNQGARNKQELNQNRRSTNPNISNPQREEKSVLNRPNENRRAVNIEQNNNRPASNTYKSIEKHEQRRSITNDRINNPSSTNKSKNIDRNETKKVENKADTKEKPSSVQPRSRSMNTTKPTVEKPQNRQSNQKSEVTKSTNSRRIETTNKKEQKPEKNSDSNSRR